MLNDINYCQQANIAAAASMFLVSHLHNHTKAPVYIYNCVSKRFKYLQEFQVSCLEGQLQNLLQGRIRDAATLPGPQGIFSCTEISSPKYSVPGVDEP